MAATKEITRLEKSSVKLSLTVPKEDVRTKYHEMIKEYTKSVQIPGFRKGKVPKEVLERKFGESLKGEAVGHIVESALQEVFKDENLPREERPLSYSTPQLQDVPELDFDKDLHFSVVYDVLPEVKVNQWKGLTVEAPNGEVEEEDINRELEEIRERNSIVMDRGEDAQAQKGDIVTVDYNTLDENGTVSPDDERKDFVFTIGSSRGVYQFDDEITGMKKGETKEFEKTYPQDYAEAHLAGQTIKFRVSLTALKEKKLPELDDDLAQDVDEKFNTLEDLKNSIRERLNKNLETRLRDLKIEKLLQKIMENTPVVLPESMIQAETEGRWRRLARMYGMDVENLMKLMTHTERKREDIESEWRESVEKALHSRLIVETLAEEQNFDVSEAEIEAEFAKIAAGYNADIEEVKKRYQEDKAKEFLAEEIKERKLFELMIAENTFNPGEKRKYLDLMANNV